MSNVRNRIAVTFLAIFFPGAAFADLTGTVTLTTNMAVSLDTGKTSSSGGDLLWNGSTLAPQGNAVAVNLTANTPGAPSGSYGFTGALGLVSGVNALTLTQLGASSSAMGSLVAGTANGTVIAVGANGGHIALLLVTALSVGSITLQYDILGNFVTSTAPAITAVQNNYSYVPAGVPNYGIAPGTLFIITGKNLASATVATLQNPAAGLPTSLSNTSILVTVGGVTTTPPIYYSIATQIAAILPSNTPIGTGTITVTYNGTTSAAAAITVLPSAFGLDTYYGGSLGLGVATNPTTGALYNYTNSIAPGATIVLWGSGLGSTGDSDTTNTSTPHAVANPPTFYVGGIAVTPLYAGRSAYPGVDQVNLTIPTSVATGCGISVVAVSGSGSTSIAGNSVTLPIAAGGGVCSDPALGYNGTQLNNMAVQAGVGNYGNLTIVQNTSPTSGGPGSEGAIIFDELDYFGNQPIVGVTSLGNCVGSGSYATGATTQVVRGLDAGTITIQGPTGSQSLDDSLAVNSGETSAIGEYYFYQLPGSFFPTTGGTFTITGSGGSQSYFSPSFVGPFTTTVNYRPALVWTNSSAITTVTRANGLTITWTGGVANSYVYISGASSANGVGGGFTCYAPSGAGTFTVPAYLLQSMPASASGSLTINNNLVSTFTAPGLNTGTVVVGMTFTINPIYN